MSDTIRSFGRKAFRRPLTDAEIARFETLGTLSPEGTPDEVAEATLFAFLASPSFLTLPELGQEREGEAVKLTQHEVAARLSFLLWGTVPDDTLAALADAGQLATREQIFAEAERMVQVREKSAPIVALMHRFYANIREGSHWATLDHDPEKFPNYSPEAVEPMMREIDAFFEEVTFGGGSFQDLFLGTVGFVNEDTAALYGLDPSAYGPELTRVDLDPATRPGFLTRVGFLSSYSRYESTSPILRGAFVAERIVGVEIKAPPPGASDTPIPEGNYTTNRQVVEALTSSAACAGCHRTYINPPGFALEAYDSVGSWQVTDQLGGPIDSTAEVYRGDGTSVVVTSPLELMTTLASDPAVQRRYAELVVAFATGRDPNSNDACLVDQFGAQLSQDGFTLMQLLAQLTQADSFRLRTIGE